MLPLRQPFRRAEACCRENCLVRGFQPALFYRFLDPEPMERWHSFLAQPTGECGRLCVAMMAKVGVALHVAVFCVLTQCFLVLLETKVAQETSE